MSIPVDSSKQLTFQSSSSQAVGLVERFKQRYTQNRNQFDQWVYRKLPAFVLNSPSFYCSLPRFAAAFAILISGVAEDSAFRAAGAIGAKMVQGVGLASKGKEVKVQGPDAQSWVEHAQRQLNRLAHPIEHPVVTKGALLALIGGAYAISSASSGRVFELVRALATIVSGVSLTHFVRFDLPFSSKNLQKPLSFDSSSSQAIGISGIESESRLIASRARATRLGFSILAACNIFTIAEGIEAKDGWVAAAGIGFIVGNLLQAATAVSDVALQQNKQQAPPVPSIMSNPSINPTNITPSK